MKKHEKEKIQDFVNFYDKKIVKHKNYPKRFEFLIRMYEHNRKMKSKEIVKQDEL